MVNFETLVLIEKHCCLWEADISKIINLVVGWNSDYDLFYRIFDPSDGTFITDEVRITNDIDSNIDEIQTF